MAKEEAKSTEVAVKPSGGAVSGYDYGEQAGAGFEGTTSDDLSIPFLGILQSNSPQVEDKDPEGAESGMFFNTVTRELTSGEEGQVFLPVHKDMAFVEWVPRNKGGGFVGLHDPNSELVKKSSVDENGQRIMGKIELDNGNELVETYYVYGLLLDADGKNSNGFAVVGFTSTKIKPQRDWFTAMYTLKGRPPLFANRAVLRTIKQKNEHGTFYNFRIDPFAATWKESLIDPATERELLEEAQAFREMVTSGMAKAAYDTERDAVGTGKTTDGADDVPF